MSTIKNSIRIYIPQGNGIEAGFYDVIGYYGPDIQIQSDYYIIDVNNQNYPLIKSGTEYFYLPYDSETGYSVSSLNDSDYNNNRVHGLVLNDSMMIYQDRVGDFNGLGYDRPLCQNISINNISTQVVAYRAYHMEIFDSYAIRTFDGTIHDEYNIIDASQEEIILVESNPENYVFDPEGGTVKELYQFTVDCGKQISNVKQSIGAVDICVYEKNTKSIVSHVNSSTIQYSGTSFSFYLSTKVVTSGLYFLYLPSSIIEFVNGTESPFTLIGYKIEVDETGNDIQNYEYQSTGKTLEKVRIKFLNTGTYSIGIDVTKTITVKDNNGNIVLSPNNSAYNTTVTYLNKISNNTIEFDLKKVINNPGSQEIVYTIEIPAETFRLSADDYNTKITLQYTIIPESQDLPVDNNLIVKVEPSSNSNVFKLDKIRVKFYQDNYLSSSTSVWNNSNKAITLTNYNSETVATSSSPSFTPVEYEQGYKVFVFEFQLSNEITTPGSYTLNIPAEKFYIGVGNTASAAITCSYNLIELNKERYINKYCYEMIQIVPTLNEIIERNDGVELSFRKENTIFIDGLKMSDILFSPVLSIIEEENNETQRVTYYNPFQNGNDILEMISTLSVQLSDGTEKLETVVYNSKDSNNNSNGFLYGLDLNNNRVAYKLCNFSLGPTQETEGLFFKNERIGQVPRSMSLTIYIKLNGAAVQTGVNIQILDDEVYTKFKENNNWVYEKKIDIYSGEECDHIYVTPSPTESYDSLVKTVTTNDQGELVTRYEVDLAPVTKVRLGNLDGIYNETFGKKQPFGYGLYGQNVFLTGNFLLNNGRSMLDIDNDITMAVGNIANVQNGLSELENRLDENSRLFDKKVSNAEKGVSSTISNYISTNRDAIFKLGLDYSMWSLGSAGISLYNPNVKYKTNESGERVVDENTVGDFDEGVLIQADRLRINNYKSVKIGNDTYYQVLITSINPKDWVYPPANAGEDSNVLFFPKAKDLVSGYRTIPFQYRYIKQQDFTNGKFKLDSTLGCEEILKYVYIAEDSEGKPYALENQNQVSDTEISYTAYAFNSFYKSTSTSTFYDISSSNVVSDSGITDQVWFLPTIVQAALFNNGKIYAKYIETEGLQVEHVIAIPKSYVDKNGVTKVIDIDYRKNDLFNISNVIDETNYPVVRDISSSNEDGETITVTEPDRDAPFVIISGATGKVTAMSADINGDLTIGSPLNDTSYLKLYKGENSEAPGMYIYRREGDSVQEVATFGAEIKDDPLYRFKGEGSGSITSTEYYCTTKNTSVSATAVPELTPLNHAQAQNNDGMQRYYDYFASNDNTTVSDGYITIGTEPQLTTPVYIKGNILYSTIHNLTKGSSYNSDMYTYGHSNIYLIECDENGVINASNIIFLGSSSRSYSKYYDSWSGIYRSYSTSNTPNAKFNATIPAGSGSRFKLYCRNSVSVRISSNAQSIGTLSEVTCTFTPGIAYLTNFEYDTQKYHADFFGNGLTIGYNKDNYFGTYFNRTSNKMVFDFKSNGAGMLFDDGNIYNYIKSNKIKSFIPILQGTIVKNTHSYFGERYYHNFRGTSIISNGSYGSSHSVYCGWYFPFRNQDVYCYKHDNSEDNQVVIDDVMVTYSSQHDIYIYRYGTGKYTLCFGQKWDALLGSGFCKEEKLLINCTGKLTNDSENGNSEYANNPTAHSQQWAGTCFVTIPTIDYNTYTFPELHTIKRDTNEHDLPAYTSSPANSSGQVTIYGNICFFTSDDHTLNDGEFYISVSYCPNISN